MCDCDTQCPCNVFTLAIKLRLNCCKCLRSACKLCRRCNTKSVHAMLIGGKAVLKIKGRMWLMR